MRIKAFAATAAGVMLFSSAAMADTTIHFLHLQENPGVIALWTQIAKDFEAANPGVHVELQYLENEALKAKLPTMLQSSDKPNLFQSWGGGVLLDQYKAGVLQDVTAEAGDLEKEISAGPASVYKIDDKIVGAPYLVSEVPFFYNKALFANAGVKAEDIKTWDDLLGAVKKIKAGGTVPICLGGGDKWPVHFYWSYLVLRAGGGNILAEAKATKDGFKGPAFVEAGKKLKELAALEPFQPGYLAAKFQEASGLWGDGKCAMSLMGNWFLNTEADNAQDKKGQPIDNIGVFQFPTLPGGKGAATVTLGGADGNIVSKGSPPETVKFLTFFEQAKYQREAAAHGWYIPAALGTADAITNPVLRSIAEDVAHSTKHQLFFDQDLGASVGRVVNDSSVAIAGGQMTPEQAADAVQKAWDEK
jgi:raffinose/stachyose/melibiose transport system substrate-binding protein